MGDRLRLAVGVMGIFPLQISSLRLDELHSYAQNLYILIIYLAGNVGSLLLYSAPMYGPKTKNSLLYSSTRSTSKNVVEFSAFRVVFEILIYYILLVLRLTFARVIKKKSTEKFSCVPYVLALFNCYLYTWYGLPVVSNQWENFPLITINGLGVLLELSFIIIYLWFASAKGKAS